MNDSDIILILIIIHILIHISLILIHIIITWSSPPCQTRSPCWSAGWPLALPPSWSWSWSWEWRTVYFWYFGISGIFGNSRSIVHHSIDSLSWCWKKPRRSDIGIFSFAGAILHSYIYNVSVMSCFLGKGNLNCTRFRQTKCAKISKSIHMHKIGDHLVHVKRRKNLRILSVWCMLAWLITEHVCSKISRFSDTPMTIVEWSKAWHPKPFITTVILDEGDLVKYEM